MYCRHCGTKNSVDSRFCSGCSSPLSEVQTNVDLYKPREEHKEPLHPTHREYEEGKTTSYWFKTLLLISIPIVNIIMLFIWSAEEKGRPRRTFSRAMLIVLPFNIIFALFIILVVSSLEEGTEEPNLETPSGVEKVVITEEKEEPTPAPKEPEITPEEIRNNYISSAKTYSYEELARNGDNLKGEVVKLDGKVVQIFGESRNKAYLVISEVNEHGYATYDTVIVTYKYTEGESRILSNDTITVFGEIAGLQQYETLIGSAKVMHPTVKAEYIFIK